MKKVLLLFVITCSSLTSCSDFLKNEAEVQSEKDDAALKVYLKSQSKYTFLKSESKAYYAITEPNPNGIKVLPGDEVTFFYKISVLDAAPFDSASEFKNLPATAVFNGSAYLTKVNNLSDIAANLPGLSEGVIRTKSGERSIGIIPSSWGFGELTIGNLIPPFSNLRVDLKMLKVRNEIQQVVDYVSTYTAANNQKVIDSTADGFRLISISSNPDGAAVKQGIPVSVKYTGYLVRGLVKFDGGDYPFTPGAGAAITGFDRAVSKMKIGDKARAVFPSTFGYGKAGSQSTIPGYAPLIFDLEVVKQ